MEALIKAIQTRTDEKILTARKDFQKGEIDCKNGIYDKWYRYHREDDGLAYDKGWMFQNGTTQNEEVKFLSGN